MRNTFFEPQYKWTISALTLFCNTTQEIFLRFCDYCSAPGIQFWCRLMSDRRNRWRPLQVAADITCEDCQGCCDDMGMLVNCCLSWEERVSIFGASKSYYTSPPCIFSVRWCIETIEGWTSIRGTTLKKWKHYYFLYYMVCSNTGIPCNICPWETCIPGTALKCTTGLYQVQDANCQLWHFGSLL